MHPDIMQAIIRDRSSRMRDEADSSHRRTHDESAAKQGRRGTKASSGSSGRRRGRSG